MSKDWKHNRLGVVQNQSMLLEDQALLEFGDPEENPEPKLQEKLKPKPQEEPKQTKIKDEASQFDLDTSIEIYKAFEQQRAKLPKMLELRYAEHRYGLSYDSIRGLRAELPEKKKHRIIIFTTMGNVTLIGVHLENLNAALLEKAVVWVQKFYKESHARSLLQGKAYWKLSNVKQAIIEDIIFKEQKS